jgi:hypothetical protein
MICKGIGVGLTLNPEGGEVGVMLSLHDEEGDEDARGWIVLPVDKAMEIASSMVARAWEGRRLEIEIQSTPMDDRDAVIEKIVDRMHGPTN